MPVVGDFIEIVGDRALTIASRPQEVQFDTGGRDSRSTAFLLFNVRGLTDTSGEVAVRVNNQEVGTIFPYPGASQEHWYAQMISFGGSNLNSGRNELEIAVAFDSSNSPAPFRVKNVMCFFHQDT